METEEVRIENVRKECHENKFHCYGKSYVYGERVNKYERRLRTINFIGLIVPLLFGGYLLTFGTNSIKEGAVYVGGAILFVQLFFSAFALVFKWDDELAYSLEATRDHNLLSQDFKTLGQFPPISVKELTARYNILNEKLKSRNEQDVKHDLSDKERIKGMRWSLREFKRPCVSCGQIPYSIEKTDCPVCGKY
ncbi:mobilome CxxCx(11)CxxC protein [Flavobacterium sp. SUN052]|uniref:mobilome CxxCx(11)CxxC protein n=1 Tax=Flavobacterium sp. SUN052 TaxID=3002441 RepID=UPI00237E717F|nr:mobilome CxxCx(11)CxxC protein [Flavobacterium sp. SUN052]MEC4004838.1 mobilome CxxCx(11)CxxC protein [Flavobacterium sp. SUN052]